MKSTVPHKLSDVEKIITVGGAEIERSLQPMRKEVWRRYPALFALLVTIGVTATFTGIEQLLLSVDFLRNNPLVILVIGVLALVITGTVYKKLT